MNDQNHDKALKKVLLYLSARDHSTEELRKKLSKTFDRVTTDLALEKAKKQGLLESPDVLSKKIVQDLHGRLKSHSYICSHLEAKKLPEPEFDGEKELEKAKKLLERKFQNKSFSTKSEQKKAFLYLRYRLFDSNTINKIIDDF